MRPDEIKMEIVIPKGVTVNIAGKILTAKGPKGEVSRQFDNPNVLISVKGDRVVLEAKKPSKMEKKSLLTYDAHINNMVKGVVEPFKYILKICSTHFPMNVTFAKNEVIVKNFLGEKSPRVLKVPQDITVKVSDKQIDVESCNKERAGMVASNIEQMTRITNKDRRIFQDGIFITNKAGKELK